MFIFPCFACGLAIRVMDVSEESNILRSQDSPFVEHGYNCPCCDAKIQLFFEKDIDSLLQRGLHIRDLSPLEAFLAFSGSGLPEEHDCSAASVKTALATGIDDVHLFDIPNTQRSCLLTIRCKDGTLIHFGSSTVGAVAYRLQKKFSYREQLEKGG